MVEKIIDVEKILKDNFKNRKSFPTFLINFLRRFLYEEKLNDIVEKTRHLSGLNWATGVLDYFNIKLEVNHEQYASLPGRFIFVPNHNLGGLDGLAIFSILSKYHQAARSLSNSFLLVIPNTHSLIVPVNNKTNTTKEFLLKVDELYASDEQVLVFPAGLVARKINGRIQDPLWSKSFVAKAIQHKRWIVPVYIDTKNQPKFYRYYPIRKFLSKLLNTNIERYFLLRQSFTHRNNTFKINFGKPFSYELFDKTKDHHQWAQSVRAHVYKLGLNNDIDFQGK